jgi:hypothetical protein
MHSVVFVAIALPYTPLAPILGFVPLPAAFFAFLGAATVTYLVLVELVKRLLFTRREAGARRPEARARPKALASA